MIDINKIEDIYPAIDELIKVLAQKNEEQISDLLRHRMYKVSWTSRCELFEELQHVLEDYLQKGISNNDKQIADQIEEVLKSIKKSF